MADAHAHDDPNAAPVHHDIQGRFSQGQEFFCYLLALLALVAGVVAGLTIVNN
jgi:hypothetical protein